MRKLQKKCSSWAEPSFCQKGAWEKNWKILGKACRFPVLKAVRKWSRLSNTKTCQVGYHFLAIKEAVLEYESVLQTSSMNQTSLFSGFWLTTCHCSGFIAALLRTKRACFHWFCQILKENKKTQCFIETAACFPAGLKYLGHFCSLTRIWIARVLWQSVTMMSDDSDNSESPAASGWAFLWSTCGDETSIRDSLLHSFPLILHSMLA